MKQTHTLMLGGEEHDVDFEISADIFYDPGKNYGPPENCYPPDGGCDITDVTVLTKVEGFTDGEIVDALEAQRSDEVEAELWDWYHSRGSDD